MENEDRERKRWVEKEIDDNLVVLIVNVYESHLMCNYVTLNLI